ncbi:ribosomal protein S4 [Pirellula staleyi DSM 6068]|uniref:Small ribosomal subunit protein uS4 n=1 Tax=Pirellula staleyi (strain ATCC 27377 / DSM 6068 / ICPB 4128) TaxID=530564 RepID=D2R163_PIRSD|nr:30S ribosomal protein S4 [Pirellula staleyi]ADB18548.1 ribosomal protein S4 [Pirellula staleyi DSM 6068]
MARYHGPKARVNRRLGALIYEAAGAARALERRDNPPGMHIKGRRLSNWGMASAEKQKIKHYYGLGERQLRKYYHMVAAKKGNTGEQLLTLCERRLDNVVRRAGYTKTRPQARQGIVHGHFFVNGVKVTSPSYQLRPGDVITIRPKEAIYGLYKGVCDNHAPQTPEWLTFDSESLRATMMGIPGPGDYSLPVNVDIVVEFLSR